MLLESKLDAAQICLCSLDSDNLRCPSDVTNISRYRAFRGLALEILRSKRAETPLAAVAAALRTTALSVLMWRNMRGKGPVCVRFDDLDADAWPLQVCIPDAADSIWVSRSAAALGLIARSLDPDLEYAVRRHPEAMEALVIDATLHPDVLEQGHSLPLGRKVLETMLESAELSDGSDREHLPTSHVPSKTPWAQVLRVARRQTPPSVWVNIQTSAAPNCVEPYGFVEVADASVLHGRIVRVGTAVLANDHFLRARPPFVYPAPIMELPDSSIVTLDPWLQHVELQDAVFMGGSTNWAHFVFDYVPRLLHLARRASAIPRTILIQQGMDGAQLEVLETLMPSTELVEARYGSEYLVKHLFIPTQSHSLLHVDPELSSCANMHTAYFKELSNILRAKYVDIDSLSRSKRIAIRRPVGKFRPLRNSEELWNALAGAGFEVVETTGMSCAERAEVFGQAECVVAEYGASSGNLLFSPPGAKVVILKTPGDANLSDVRNVCKALGLSYSEVIGRAARLARGNYAVDGFHISVSQVLAQLSDDG